MNNRDVIFDDVVSLIEETLPNIIEWDLNMDLLSSLNVPENHFISLDEVKTHELLHPFYPILKFCNKYNALWSVIDITNPYNKSYPYYVTIQRLQRPELWFDFLNYPRNSQEHFGEFLLDLSRLVLGEDENPIYPVILSKVELNNYYPGARELHIGDIYKNITEKYCSNSHTKPKDIKELIDNFSAWCTNNPEQINKEAVWERMQKRWRIENRHAVQDTKDKEQKFLNYLFWLTAQSDEWSCYLYIPGVIRSDNTYRTAGGLSFAFKSEPDPLLYIAIWEIVSRLLENWTRAYSDLFKYVATSTSAVSAIMARNFSHIHGSHIESGLQNRLDSFNKTVWDTVIADRAIMSLFPSYISPSSASKEALIDLTIEEKFFLQNISIDSQKRLSYYRQGKEELISRIVIDWPSWGIDLDLYCSVINPLIRNSLLLHFINLSDSIDITKTKVSVGYFSEDELIYFSEKLDISGKNIESSPILMSIFSGTHSNKTNLSIDNYTPLFVRLRDGDIGAYAIISFIEGVLRNSGKHKPEACKGKTLELKVILCSNQDELSSIVSFAGQSNIMIEGYNFLVITSSLDVLTVNGKKRIIRNNNNVCLRQYIHDELNKRVVSNAGIEPGNWGLKELKICAAFASFSDITSINSNNVGFVDVGETTPKLWRDDTPRLAYVICLNKARYVLIVCSNKKSIRPEFEEYGVSIVSLDTLSTLTNYDYDFIYTDDIEIKQKLKNNTVISLPQRIVIGESIDNKSPVDVYSIVYKAYLSSILHPSNRYKVCIYFEDETKASLWNKWYKENKEYFLDINVSFYFPDTDEDYDEFDADSSDVKILLQRHTGISHYRQNTWDSVKDGTTYAEYATYSSLFFSLLFSIDPYNYGYRILCKFIESSVLKVLVVDERIAQATSQYVEDGSGTKITLAEKLYWMGITVAHSVKVDDSILFEYVDEHDQKLCELNMADIKTGNSLTIDGFSIDIILIHTSIVVKLSDAMQTTPEELLVLLKKKIRHVIIHSGRGNTDSIPQNIPFLEYSTMQRYIIQEPSKFYLVQLALSAK